MIRKNIKLFVGIIIGIIISGVGVYALSIASKDVSYDNTNSEAESTNVQDAVDELYDILNNPGKIDLLWTNPDTSATFLSQTIPLDLTEYDGIIMLTWYAGGPYDGEEYEYMSKGENRKVVFGTYSTFHSYRTVAVRDNEIGFSNGAYKGASSATNNSYAIPVKIYGVKGSLPDSE